MSGMGRREFVVLLGGAAAAWPLTARAQEPKRPVRIGFLPLGSPSNASDRSQAEAFRQGLRQAGLVENQDIVLDMVWSGNDPDQGVKELLQRGAQILVPAGSTAAVAAQRQAPALPIVFISVGNPIAMGLVENLSRPGRNATGFSDILGDLGGNCWFSTPVVRTRSTPLSPQCGNALSQQFLLVPTHFSPAAVSRLSRWQCVT